MKTKRKAFKMYLNPGSEVEYQKRHNKIWPEIKKLLKEAGVSDYSIFFDKETNSLFAVQKNISEKNSQDLGGNEIMQKWWNYMADLMKTNPDNSPISVPLPELFYLE